MYKFRAMPVDINKYLSLVYNGKESSVSTVYGEAFIISQFACLLSPNINIIFTKYEGKIKIHTGTTVCGLKYLDS